MTWQLEEANVMQTFHKNPVCDSDSSAWLGPAPASRFCPGPVIINSLRKNYMLLIGSQIDWHLTQTRLGPRHISIFRNHPAWQSTSSLNIKKTKMIKNKFENLTEALAVNIKAFQSDNQFTFLISMKFSHILTALSLGLRKADNCRVGVSGWNCIK